jgi:hypothetical protein
MESSIGDKPLAALGPRGGAATCQKCEKVIADGEPRTVEVWWPLMDKKGSWARHMVRTATCVGCDARSG